MNAQRPPRTPERVDIGYSPVLVALASVVYVLALCYCLFGAALLFSNDWLAMGIGLFAAFLFLPLLLSFFPQMLHAWTHRGPVLSMDIGGVTDVRKKSPYLPWSDVAVVDLGVGSQVSYLCFEFRRADRTRQDAAFGPLGLLWGRIHGGLRDWNVSLHLLACKRREARQMAETMRQESIRAHVVATNRLGVSADDPNQGWSGRL